MLQLTPEATTHLLEVRTQRGLDDHNAARFIAKGEGLRLTFATTPQPGDRVIEQPDISVFVAADVAVALDTSIVDTRLKEGKSVLVLRSQGASARQG
jgi:Fe-S cluster assembly iron-binding protein IscA